MTFVDAFEAAAMMKDCFSNTIIEVGPKPVLTKLAKSIQPAHKTLQWIVSLEEGVSLTPESSLALIYKSSRLPSSSLDQVFPNRTCLPWHGSSPHPLLQECQTISTSAEFSTVFHDNLLEFFFDSGISSQNYFLIAGYVEMGLAASSFMSSRDTVIELVGLKCVRPFRVAAGCKLTLIHHFGSGIQFLDSIEEHHVAASISRVYVNPIFVAATETLSNLKANHSKQMTDFPGHCNPLALTQTIQNAMLSEDCTSVLALIDLPSDVKHEYDVSYRFHPNLLEAAFQLLGIMVRSNDQL